MNDRYLNRLETRFSLKIISLFIGFSLFLIAMVYVAPNFDPDSWGIYYVRLASNPFDLNNPVVFRFLAPLIAFVLGLHGKGIIAVNYAAALFLIGTVYYHYRQKEWSPTLCLLTSGLIAFSMPTLCTLKYGCITDSLSYFLIFLMITFASRPYLFWGIFFVALFNREAIVFLIPFFLLLRKRKSYIPLVLCGFLYLTFRWFLLNESHYTTNFYFQPLLNDPLFWIKQIAKRFYVGLFSGFKLFWIIPIMGMWYSLKRKNFYSFFLILTPIICAVAQLVIAIDTSRMISLAFPAILMGTEVLYREYGEEQLIRYLFPLIIVNFFVPQLYVIGDEISVMYSLFSRMVYVFL